MGSCAPTLELIDGRHQHSAPYISLASSVAAWCTMCPSVAAPRTGQDMAPSRFTIDIDQGVLDDVRARLGRTRWANDLGDPG